MTSSQVGSEKWWLACRAHGLVCVAVLVFAAGLLPRTARAQLAFDGTPLALELEDYLGSGLSPGASVPGSLDSNSWYAYSSPTEVCTAAATCTAPTFAGGLVIAAGVMPAERLCAWRPFGVETAIGVRPGNTAWDGGGIGIAYVNRSGAAITALVIEWGFFAYNRGPADARFEVFLDPDAEGPASLAIAELTASSAGMDAIARTPSTVVDLSASPIPPDGRFYLTFTIGITCGTPAGCGVGPSDEIGIDRVAISLPPTTIDGGMNDAATSMDAGGGADAGAVDAAADLDAALGIDATAGTDAPLAFDGGIGVDAPSGLDGGALDGGTLDGGTLDGASSDGGPDAASALDAARADGGLDASTNPVGAAGCACRAGGADRREGALWAGAALALLGVVRRRRRSD